MWSKHYLQILIGMGNQRTCVSKEASIEEAKCCQEVGICKNPCKLGQRAMELSAFLDESKFEIFWKKRHIFIRRFEGERYTKYFFQPTVKHGGGSIIIWGVISTKGALPLKLIEGKMDVKVILCRTRCSLTLKRLIYFTNFRYYTYTTKFWLDMFFLEKRGF